MMFRYMVTYSDGGRQDWDGMQRGLWIGYHFGPIPFALLLCLGSIWFELRHPFATWRTRRAAVTSKPLWVYWLYVLRRKPAFSRQAR